MDKGKNTAVYAIYADSAKAENAVQLLKDAAFKNTDISLIFPDNHPNKGSVVAADPTPAGQPDDAPVPVKEKQTKLPEAATVGAASGVVAGGVFGWLVGIGALAIPGLGPIIAAGPILAMLGGAGVGGALAGMLGALMGLGIPEYDAQRYEARIRRGEILVSVHCDSEESMKKAREILQSAGGDDISATAETTNNYVAPTTV